MNTIKKINPKHHIIINRLLSGQTQRQIAKDMSLSETWVSLVVNDPRFKDEYQKLVDEVRAKVIDTSAEVQEIINAAAPKAAQKIVTLMDEFDPSIRLKVAKEVVDKSDFGKDRLKESNKPIVITQQQMILIEEGMKE